MTVIKKQLFEQLALIAHSLASPQRVEMLDYLAQAERGVDELSKLAGLTGTDFPVTGDVHFNG